MQVTGARPKITVTAGGKGVVGHAGARLLADLAGATGLTGQFSQALAGLRGRDFVIPSDVQALCPPLLTHRIHISPQTRLRGRTPQEIVAEIVEKAPVPVNE